MIRNLFFGFVIIAVLSSPAFAEGSGRTCALEVEYGASSTNFLPLNNNGQAIYGAPVITNPLTARILWAAAPLLNIGISYSSSFWMTGRSFLVGAVYSSPKLSFTTISPFIDLAPFAIAPEEKNGITKGIFLEAGPAFTTVSEEFGLNGSPYSFSSSGVSLILSLGLRSMNREPLAFITSVDASIPVCYDGGRSITGVTLNGSVTLGINAGISLSF